MIFPFLPLFLAKLDAQPTLKRVASFLKSSEQLDVSFKATSKTDTGTGVIRRDGANRGFYRFSFPRGTYTFVCKDGYGVEYSTGSKRFRDFEAAGPVAVPKDAISPLAGLVFPNVFLYRDYRFAFPNGANVALLKTTGKVDVIVGSYVDGYDKVKVQAYIDGAGRPLKLIVNDSLTIEYAYHQPKFDAKTFSTALPTGLQPAALQDPVQPLAIGANLPNGTNIRNGAQVSELLQWIVKGTWVVALYDPNEPEQVALDAKAQSKAQAAGAKYLAIGIADGGPRAWAVPADHSLMANLRPQGTPCFYLFQNGTLKLIWLGKSAVNDKNFGKLPKDDGGG